MMLVAINIDVAEHRHEFQRSGCVVITTDSLNGVSKIEPTMSAYSQLTQIFRLQYAVDTNSQFMPSHNRFNGLSFISCIEVVLPNVMNLAHAFVQVENQMNEIHELYL